MSNRIVKCHVCRRWVIGQKTIKPYSLADMVAVAFFGFIIGIIAVEQSRRSWLRCPHCGRVMRRPTSRVTTSICWLFGAAGVIAATYLLIPVILEASPTLDDRLEPITTIVQNHAAEVVMAGGVLLTILLLTIIILAMQFTRMQTQLKQRKLRDTADAIEQRPVETEFFSPSDPALKRGTNPFTDLISE